MHREWVMKVRQFAGVALSVACATLLLSCSTQSSIESRLPGPVPMNDHAGNGAPLIVNLRVGTGEELPFIIDTGAFCTLIDSSLTNRFGQYRGKAVGASFIGEPKKDMAVYDAPELYLGNTRLRLSKLIVSTDLQSKSHPIKGILGMDCLKHYCIQLNFDRREIRFLDQNQLDKAKLGQPFPLLMKKAPLGGAEIYVDAPIAEQGTIRVWVDTGFSSEGDFMFKPDLFNRLLTHHRPTQTGVYSVGQRDWRAARFSNLGIGGYHYQDLWIAEMPADLAKVPAWMSLQFLARNQVTFNFPKQVMYLRQRDQVP